MPDKQPTRTVRRPALEPMAENAIEEIERETGKRLAPEYVVWLQDAATHAARPDRESPRLIDLPTECGGVLLWPLTYFAVYWHSTVAFPNYGNDARIWGYTLAYCHEPDMLAGLTNRKDIRLASNAWLKTLHCSPAELRAVVETMLGREELVSIPNLAPNPEAPDLSARDWGDTVALLCKKFTGTAPEYWTCRVSIRYASEMLDRACEHLPDDKRPSFDDTAEFICLTAYIKAQLMKAEAPAA